MLSCIKKLAGATQNLLMGGNMTMDVRASMVSLLLPRWMETLGKASSYLRMPLSPLMDPL